ncbi:unnamed protein product [Rotaria magnacalcarata]|uniref:Uncharacterized protein n=1 Tax=Rotaria magnacalcarata TaxID=392030 RepID=A0A815Z966_9BILA|nr:unnamed protein product [Rotaria magnacalcarata]CAF1580530.1 unnamed protein product [Rotaria magnacalcarata]CAF4302644.1 unnamed protein product [Rotaria magnacalcarata]CAF4750796.1 unnamed protein product [Rotaria magnacalcarata]
MIGLKTHLTLLLIGFISWAIFVVIGLPDYYQSWSFTAKIVVCIVVTILYFPLAAFILRKIDNKEYFNNSLWLAFYLTLPLFIYDYTLIVLIGGDNLSFVFTYWYLSLFYVSFWIQFPFIGWSMEQKLHDSLKSK